MKDLLAIAVVRQYHEKQEAKRWENTYALQIEARARQDFLAYQQFLKKRGFEQVPQL
jgi:hypothetical protein